MKVVILFDPGAEDWTPEDIRGVMKAVDEIGPSEDDFLRKELIGFEADHIAEETESLLHRSDGGWLVPLCERVAGTVRFNVGRGIGFFVVCETDAHVVSGNLLQKRPLVRSVDRNALSSRE